MNEAESNQNRPVGVIDSGVGGLTVAKEIMRQLPKEEIVYVGDTARCPYGPRPEEEVRRFTWEMIDYLMEKNIKLLVIACNTATAVVLEEAREKLSIPVLGVIHPGAVAALKATDKEHIGVIGTEGTIHSGAYHQELTSINNRVRVVSLACPEFVPLVESGRAWKPEAESIVRKSLEPMLAYDIDTLILGCTHYPLLAPQIQKACGSGVTVIASGEETAREVSSLLYFQKLQCSSDRPPNHRFYTTGSTTNFEHIAFSWIGKELPVYSLQLEQSRAGRSR
ncbi:glutamate racemase [Alkalicoccus urumqiensis]|uniref:Glutamate racemase n=1 Tax=Alkalicoccus urumqiensis TaxID=1548213 RepID=A0A2P6MF53_ALKUR|nr:glutamate racemase [Alkalicoccus urumqiensis]PRO64932.1 glutamate racemase [Alkalicoccus urumqiensis]